LPPRLPPRQAQHSHGPGHDEEHQLQTHKSKIIARRPGLRPARRAPFAPTASAKHQPRRRRFSALTGLSRRARIGLRRPPRSGTVVVAAVAVFVALYAEWRAGRGQRTSALISSSWRSGTERYAGEIEAGP